MHVTSSLSQKHGTGRVHPLPSVTRNRTRVTTEARRATSNAYLAQARNVRRSRASTPVLAHHPLMVARSTAPNQYKFQSCVSIARWNGGAALQRPRNTRSATRQHVGNQCRFFLASAILAFSMTFISSLPPSSISACSAGVGLSTLRRASIRYCRSSSRSACFESFHFIPGGLSLGTQPCLRA